MVIERKMTSVHKITLIKVNHWMEAEEKEQQSIYL
jgi:hypothetical protein